MSSLQPNDLANLQKHAIQLLEWQKEHFPDQSDYALEVQATTLYREAVKKFSKVFRNSPAAKLIYRKAPNGEPGGLMAWAAPDWELVLYCAKLILYIALCGEYERKVFTADQRLARDVREKRHAELMQRWPIQADWRSG